jgi:hypothetical protein
LAFFPGRRAGQRIDAGNPATIELDANFRPDGAARPKRQIRAVHPVIYRYGGVRLTRTDIPRSVSDVEGIMRFASYIRQLPRLPRLPAPTPTSQDIARALTEVLQNQAAIMNEIALIKNTMLSLNAQTFSAMFEVATPDQADNLFTTFLSVNASLTQALSD